MSMSLTVGEFLEKADLAIDDAVEASEISEYYENVLSFLEDNWDTELWDLTNKQKSWLDKIKDDLREKKLEREF